MFIEEAAKLYGDALVSQNLDVSKVIGLYAMASPISDVKLMNAYLDGLRKAGLPE